MVELCIGLDGHRGTGRDLWHAALQLRVNSQVSVLVDATELLPDDQLARVPHKGHLGLARELTPCKKSKMSLSVICCLAGKPSRLACAHSANI